MTDKETPRMIHVVIVEDDMDVAFFMMNQLREEQGFQAIHITTADDAMVDDTWEYNSDSAVVGLIDIMLPGINGVDVARWVRERHPNVGLIAVTAISSMSPIWDEVQETFDRVVRKPFSPAALVEAVKNNAAGIPRGY